MENIKNKIVAFLKKNEFTYSENGNEYEFGIRGKNCNIKIRIVLVADRKQCFVVGVFPNFYKESDYCEIYKVFNKHNLETMYTKLFFDPADGEAYCSCCAICVDESFPAEMLGYYVFAISGVIDSVYGELSAVLIQH